jgi:hypothetical protein
VFQPLPSTWHIVTCIVRTCPINEQVWQSCCIDMNQCTSLMNLRTWKIHRSDSQESKFERELEFFQSIDMDLGVGGSSPSQGWISSYVWETSLILSLLAGCLTYFLFNPL